MTDQKTTPIVRIERSGYQPTKAELDEDLRIPDATPDEVAAAVMRPVTVKYIRKGNAPVPAP